MPSHTTMRYLLMALFSFSICLGAELPQPSFKDDLGRHFYLPKLTAKGIYFPSYRSSRAPDLSLWEPSKEEAAKLVPGILDFLKQFKARPEELAPMQMRDSEHARWYFSERIKEILERYDQYACQIFGLQDGETRRIGFSFFPANTLADSPKRDPFRQTIEVSDGGAGYWRIEYDLKEKKFGWFETNGDA